jgi:hypothetical protein
VLAALGLVVPLVVEVEQRVQGRIGLEPDAAAVAPVAAVGSAPGHVLLAPEADAARAPVTSLDEDVDLVDEHGRGGSEGTGAGPAITPGR